MNKHALRRIASGSTGHSGQRARALVGVDPKLDRAVLPISLALEVIPASQSTRRRCHHVISRRARTAFLWTASGQSGRHGACAHPLAEEACLGDHGKM